MTFDPFHDFETRGYLRNFDGEKDLRKIKAVEHVSFLAKLGAALDQLAQAEWISYRDVLDTHRTLFKDVYPWAGQDRAQTTPNIAVSKGSVFFAHPDDAKPAVEYALKIGQDRAAMASRPGEVMGYLAYGHPFLDGNGRTILTVHVVLAERAGISIDWAATDKAAYLTALTKELDQPGKGHLDAYLKPFVGAAIGREQLSGHIVRTPGLSGDPKESQGANQVLGSFSDPALRERYQQYVAQRGDFGSLPATEAKDQSRLEMALRSAAGEPAKDRDPSDRPPRGRGNRGR